MFGLITCRKFAEFLFDYVENTLPETQHKLFERHIYHCPQCRIFLEQYRQTIELTEAAYSEAEQSLDSMQDEPPEELIEAVISAIET